jgi:hypothetical protein
MEYDKWALYDLIHLYEGSMVRSTGGERGPNKTQIMERAPGAHWMEDLVGPTVGLDGF